MTAEELEAAIDAVNKVLAGDHEGEDIPIRYYERALDKLMDMLDALGDA